MCDAFSAFDLGSAIERGLELIDVHCLHLKNSVRHLRLSRKEAFQAKCRKRDRGIRDRWSREREQSRERRPLQ